MQFCIAYCGILAEHSLCATHVTGKLVSEATGLPITLYLHADQGGAQQIGARISFNEIDLVLFFCDPANPKGFDDINKIERLCDQYQIPFATNAATAEVLVQGLRRGDLDWRNIVNPHKTPERRKNGAVLAAPFKPFRRINQWRKKESIWQR